MNAKFAKDLVIPKKLLNEFKGKIRIIPIGPVLTGIYAPPPDFPDWYIKIDKLMQDKDVKKNFDCVLIYKGKTLDKDLEKIIGSKKPKKFPFDVRTTGIYVPFEDFKISPSIKKKFDIAIVQKSRAK